MLQFQVEAYAHFSRAVHVLIGNTKLLGLFVDVQLEVVQKLEA